MTPLRASISVGRPASRSASSELTESAGALPIVRAPPRRPGRRRASRPPPGRPRRIRRPAPRISSAIAGIVRRLRPASVTRPFTTPAQLSASLRQATVVKSAVVETAIGLCANRATKSSRALGHDDRCRIALADAARRGALRGNIDHGGNDPRRSRHRARSGRHARRRSAAPRPASPARPARPASAPAPRDVIGLGADQHPIDRPGLGPDRSARRGRASIAPSGVSTSQRARTASARRPSPQCRPAPARRRPCRRSRRGRSGRWRSSAMARLSGLRPSAQAPRSRPARACRIRDGLRSRRCGSPPPRRSAGRGSARCGSRGGRRS